MVQDARARDAQVVDDGLGRRDVAAHAPEGLGEGAHEDVDVGRVDAAVLAAALSRVAESANAMRLI